MKKSIVQKSIRMIFPVVAIIFVWSSSAFASEQYELVAEWGGFGEEEGQFISPLGLTVDSENNIYVTDIALNRIQKFTSEGDLISQWGGAGKGDGQFDTPWGIAIDNEDNVYVSDMFNDRIQKFTSDGEFITRWSTRLKGPWRLVSMPQGLAVDHDGNVYVYHVSQLLPFLGLPKSYIQKFDSEGLFINKWSFWNIAMELAVDSGGNLYAPGFIFGEIHTFSSDGTVIGRWGSCRSTSGEIACFPTAIALDREDNVYVTDYLYYNIKKFTADGEFITSWKMENSGGFTSHPTPYGLAVDSEGFVYVVDGATETVKKYGKISEGLNRGRWF
jgi:tripartite motif-containing protein 71